MSDQNEDHQKSEAYYTQLSSQKLNIDVFSRKLQNDHDKLVVPACTCGWSFLLARGSWVARHLGQVHMSAPLAPALAITAHLVDWTRRYWPLSLASLPSPIWCHSSGDSWIEPGCKSADGG